MKRLTLALSVIALATMLFCCSFAFYANAGEIDGSTPIRATGSSPTLADSPATATPVAPPALVPVVPVEAGDSVLVIVLKYLLGLFGAIVTALLPVVVKGLVSKWKIDASVAQQEKIVEIADMAWHYAEEQANKAIKQGLAGYPNDRKKGEAMSFAVSVIDTFGLPQKAAAQIEKIIEAKLHEGR